MTNILKFPSPAPVAQEQLASFREILAGTRALWQVGIVTTEALAIAAQVSWLFMKEEKPIVSMSFIETTKRFVKIESDFLAGPLPETGREAFTCGLIDLHTRCGLVNGLDKKFFNPAGNPRHHFSIPHPMRNTPFWVDDSPIFFKVQSFSSPAYQEFIQRQIQERLFGCAVLTLTKG